jgi:hydroxymethylglutaryl-CoA lyase
MEEALEPAARTGTDEAVVIVEVGARDGLQNESTMIGSAAKVDVSRRIEADGSRRIEVASFVHRDRVPQMADADHVVAELGSSPAGVSHIGLALNRRGMERALSSTVDEINLVVGASEGFNRANDGVSPKSTLSEIRTMIPEVRGRRTTVTISVAFGCPYDGPVPVDAVAQLASEAAETGASEVALGDTIGVAVPSAVQATVDAVQRVTNVPLRYHFHETRNTAVANVVAAYRCGITTFGASVGGAGGCPFAPNATGNVATEDLLYLFDRMGPATGIDPLQTIATTRWLERCLGRELPSSVARARWWPMRDTRH